MNEQSEEHENMTEQEWTVLLSMAAQAPLANLQQAEELKRIIVKAARQVGVLEEKENEPRIQIQERVKEDPEGLRGRGDGPVATFGT